MDDKQMTTVSGGLPAQLSPHSRMRQEGLRPASADDFQRELTSCLALCAASGMNDADRREWLITARATLVGIPADLLVRGCAVARKYCDHPSRIVPTIMREVETTWETRKKAWGERRPSDAPALARPEPADYVTPEEAAAILAEFGLKRDPSQPLVEPPVEALPPIHIPRSPVQAVELADHEIPSVTGLSINEIFEQRDRIRAGKLMGERSSGPEPLPEDYERFFAA